MHNILVTGANGQLGSELRALEFHYPSYNFIFTDSKQLDITTYRAVEKYIEQNAITAIINCAAYTAVDKAETDSTKANALNHLAVENLAKISKARGITLIHISTDYVFDGTSDRPYTEEDVPNPQSVYGKTKLAGEKAMQRVNPPNSIIIRTSWLYSNYGTNFVKTMLRLGKEKNEISVIADQKGTPTYAGDLAKTILEILPKIKNDKVEVYHYSNEGVCSWYDFAKAIFALKKMFIKVDPIKSTEFPTPAKRPHYSILNKRKIIEAFQLKIPTWEDSLARCLRKPEPKILKLPKILDIRGNLSWFENSNQIPFDIKRTYFINDVPGGEIRGGHAFRKSTEFIVALSGSLDVVLNDGNKEIKYSLNRSDYGLYIPNLIWRKMENFSANAFALIVSSISYNTADYIRDFENFQIIRNEAKG
ncbi:dTDP-4-dehydrorhamnose reductase [uncultured Eudoraea sp.]|uniref:dTDP-4-dehydrorhamnose reductase n=1 Tax=uncultured Eudoraea sp. TaxID=1035614 RepID=UPI00345CBE8E